SKIERAPNWSTQIKRKKTSLTETGHLQEAKIRAQSGFKPSEEDDVIGGRVIPIARPFFPRAVRGKLGHRQRERFQSVMQDFARDLRFDVCQCQSAHANAAIANLVPVVAHLRPA